MIHLHGLCKAFGGVSAVDQVDLEVPQQGRLAIVGPSGSGKTTLLHLIAGLEMPDRGEIFINDRLVSRPGWILEPRLRDLGFVFQRPALCPHLTVAQNVLFGLKGLPRVAAQERLHEMLDFVKLDHLAHRYPSQISGGAARRVSIARTLAPKPSCLLMDEPLIHLDPSLKEEIMTLIKDGVQKNRACLVYVTHDHDEAAQIAGRVQVMRSGRMQKNSSPKADG